MQCITPADRQLCVSVAQRTLALSLSRLRRLRMAPASPRLGEPVGVPSPWEDSAPEGALSICMRVLVALLAEGRDPALPWEAARPIWASAASTACRGARMGSVGRPSPSCRKGLVRKGLVRRPVGCRARNSHAKTKRSVGCSRLGLICIPEKVWGRFHKYLGC